MFITNVDDMPQDKIYRCGNIIANWLIYEKNIPLLGKSKNGDFCFSKTDLLKEILEHIPFYYKVVSKIF